MSGQLAQSASEKATRLDEEDEGKNQAEVKGALDIAENPLDCLKMISGGSMQKLADRVHGMSNI